MLEIQCVVNNKTDKSIILFFDYDAETIGYSGDSFTNVLIWPNGFDIIDFPPMAETDGTLTFIEAAKDDMITAFWGTLAVVDADTYDTIGEYKFNLSGL